MALPTQWQVKSVCCASQGFIFKCGRRWFRSQLSQSNDLRMALWWLTLPDALHYGAIVRTDLMSFYCDWVCNKFNQELV